MCNGSSPGIIVEWMIDFLTLPVVIMRSVCIDRVMKERISTCCMEASFIAYSKRWVNKRHTD